MKASTFDMTQYVSLQYVCNVQKYFLKFLFLFMFFFLNCSLFITPALKKFIDY